MNHASGDLRFLRRRAAAALRPPDNSGPALTAGAVLTAMLLATRAVDLLGPAPTVGDGAVVMSADTGARYVRIGDTVHPVLNLTSARLIAGKPVSPKAVNARQLDKFGRGPLIGIPGAPERMVANTATDADWTVCEGIPAAGAAAGVSLIAGPPATDGERARALPGDMATRIAAGRYGYDLVGNAAADAVRAALFADGVTTLAGLYAVPADLSAMLDPA